MRIYLRKVAWCVFLTVCLTTLFLTVQQNSKEFFLLDENSFDDAARPVELDLQKFFDEKRTTKLDIINKLVVKNFKTRRPRGMTDDSLPVDIWAARSHEWNDRIINQINYIPDSYKKTRLVDKMKLILVPGGSGDTSMGRQKFEEEKCPISSCILTMNENRWEEADAILWQNSVEDMNYEKLPHQVWILWLLESPMNVVDLGWLKDKVNWTATYRSDSTIVTPYEKFVPFKNMSGLAGYANRNYAQGKTKTVAWFVSNCATSNRRMEYVQELKKYISVHIFGACGRLRCSRHKVEHCNAILNRDYKFYLSFENSNCEYYITEKLFWNALFNDIVPVVMGARKEDYLAAAPPGSFIYADDFSSPQELAAYLHKLDKDDFAYNQYFQWKGSGEFINTKFWCRLCSMLHDKRKPATWYIDIESWWRQDGTCTTGRWDDPDSIVDEWVT